MEQIRFGSRINIQKPRKPFYKRGVVTEFLTPFYKPARETVPIWEVCENIQKSQNVKLEKEPHPYQKIIARECLNWFNNSRMVAFLHKNSIKAEDEFELVVRLRKANMYLKYYGFRTISYGLRGTQYEAVLSLFCAPHMIVFSATPNVESLRKILRKTPQLILMAGALDGTLLNVNDFLKYGKMDITEARAGLVQTLRLGAGGNVCRQLTQHQSTFVSRLNQIRDSNTTVQEPKETQ